MELMETALFSYVPRYIAEHPEVLEDDPKFTE
jgi:hypothetical protein